MAGSASASLAKIAWSKCYSTLALKGELIGVEKRYFVTIIARDRESFLGLHDYDLDLVYGSARARDRKQPTIEALLTMEEVARLVEDGYRVMVEEESSKRARVRQIVGFDRWLEEMRE